MTQDGFIPTYRLSFDYAYIPPDVGITVLTEEQALYLALKMSRKYHHAVNIYVTQRIGEPERIARIEAF